MNARRRFRFQVLWGLVLLAGLPTLAQAQGLFPNQTAHRRQRQSCLNEAPVYQTYRQVYWGYYPTCWRRFPPGWGCPSPEKADPRAAMEEIGKEADKVQRSIEQEDMQAQPGDEQGAPAPGANMPPAENAVPALPTTPSPFEEQLKPGAPPAPNDAAPAPAPANPPRPNQPPADGGAAAPGASLDPSDPLRPDALPALDSGAARSPRTPVPPMTSTPVPPLGAAAGSTVIAPPEAGGPPAQAPQRRTVIGGLFDSLRGIRRR